MICKQGIKTSNVPTMFVSSCFITNASTMFVGEFVHIYVYKYPVLRNYKSQR